MQGGLREHQRKGGGFALMNAALEKLSCCKSIALLVMDGNEQPIRFYERYGFSFDGAKTALFPGSSQRESRMICFRK